MPDGETVTITLDGVKQMATVTGGAFSSTFDTSTLAVAGSPYTITYAYGGDANLKAVTNTSHKLKVKAAASSLSILVLDQQDMGALSVSGHGSISGTGTIQVNSISAAGLLATGNSKVKVSKIDVVGSYAAGPQAKLDPKPTSHAAYVSDPLSGLPVPAAAHFRDWSCSSVVRGRSARAHTLASGFRATPS